MYLFSMPEEPIFIITNVYSFGTLRFLNCSVNQLKIPKKNYYQCYDFLFVVFVQVDIVNNISKQIEKPTFCLKNNSLFEILKEHNLSRTNRNSQKFIFAIRTLSVVVKVQIETICLNILLIFIKLISFETLQLSNFSVKNVSKNHFCNSDLRFCCISNRMFKERKRTFV